MAEGLPAFRRAGIAARLEDDARRGEASQAIKLETLSVNDDENDPVPEQKPKGGKLNLKKTAADDEMDLDAELARQEAQEKAQQDRDYGF